MTHDNHERAMHAYTDTSGYGRGEKLETFTNDLRQAIDSSYPQEQYPYSAVYVLLLQWAEDDLHIHLEADMLRKVFDRQFGFQTENWQIPSQNSSRALQKKIYDFQDAHQSSTELLILYYGGRAETDLNHGRCIWRANQHRNVSSLDWSSVQPLLENAIPHVLIILDCCHKASFTKGSVRGTTKELIAASGQDSAEVGPHCRSYTSLLIEGLRSFQHTPFTVAMLHSQLIAKRQELMFSPVHVLLSASDGNSINLAPLSGNTSASAFPIASPTNGAVRLVADLPPLQGLEDTVADTRVLFLVPIIETDILDWVGWVTTHPPWDATEVDVRIESVFENSITIMLVSVPIFVWDRLPQKSAYQFVSFVKSANQLQNSFWNSLVQTAASSQGPAFKANSNGCSVARKKRSPSKPSNPSVTVSGFDPDTVISPSAIHAHPLPTRERNRSTVAFDYSSKLTVSNSKTKGKMVAFTIDGSSTPPRNQTKPNHSPISPTTEILSLLNIPIIQISESDSAPDATTHRNARKHRISHGHKRVKNNQPPVIPLETNPESSSRHPSSRTDYSRINTWGADDDRVLIKARKEGYTMADIASSYFPTKTPNACRKRHNRLMQKRVVDAWKSNV